MDDDLVMFGQPRLSIENLDSAFRYRLKKLARIVRGAHIRLEEPSTANSPEEGEHPDEEVSGAEAGSDDDDDAYTPDSVSASATGGNRASDEGEGEDEDEYWEEEPGNGQDRHPDDEDFQAGPNPRRSLSPALRRRQLKGERV